MSVPNEFKRVDALPAFFVRELVGIYDEKEVRSIARMVMEHIAGKTLIEIAGSGPASWNKRESGMISNILDRLKGGEPVQYILGYVDFFGLRFNIGPGVLIPRNETEELTDWILSDCNNIDPGISILDIGCGSGAIAVSLAKNLPEAQVYAVDIAQEAVELTLSNAERNRAGMVLGYMDVLDPSGYFSGRKYDIIVSNPPYVLESQKPFLERRVTEMEPSIALFVPDYDPLIYYRAICDFALKGLNAGGAVYVEINEQLPFETKEIFEGSFKYTEIRNDIHGKYRMIKATNGKG